LESAGAEFIVHPFTGVALMAALMEAMRTARRPLRPVLKEPSDRNLECGRFGLYSRSRLIGTLSAVEESGEYC